MAYLRKRKRGWSVYIYAPTPDPATGVQRQVLVASGLPTRKDAERVARQKEAERDRGVWADDGGMTVRDFAQDFLQRKQATLRPNTHRRYRSLLAHAVGVVGNVELRNVRLPHGQQVVNAAVAKGLGPKSVGDVHRTFHALLADAVREGKIASNPLAGRRMVSRPKERRPRLHKLTDEQVTALLTATDERDWLRTLLVLAATCGLRRSEALALRWGAVDLDAGKLHVRRALHEVDGELVLMDCKTDESSDRTITLAPSTVAVLRRHRRHQAEQRMLVGAAWCEAPLRDDAEPVTDLVLTEGDGTPVRPDQASQRFRRLVRRLRLPPVRLHDLRHYHASTLLSLGTPITVVSERLGHSDPGFTLRVYSHAMPRDEAHAVGALERVFGEALKVF
jgi:integrase